VVVEVGATVSVPPLYGRVYDVPFDPVTWTEAALATVTVRVSVCPEVIVLELALIEIVGTAAEAVAAKTEIATKVSKRVRERIVFTWACLRGLVHVPDCALEGEVVPAGWHSVPYRVRMMDGYKSV